MTCVRCGTCEALPHQTDLCAPCTVSTRLEVAAGMRRIYDYLESWTRFDVWLREHGREPALT